MFCSLSNKIARELGCPLIECQYIVCHWIAASLFPAMTDTPRPLLLSHIPQMRENTLQKWAKYDIITIEYSLLAQTCHKVNSNL